MQALRWHGVKDVRVDDIAEPATLKGKVKIKVKWCGICGSDLHEYAAGPIFIPQNSPHSLTEEKAPIVMGHEFSGQVVEVGDGVTKCEEGDRVVVEPIFACGTCTACKQGKYNLCEQLGFLGLAGGGGGFSEYVTVDEHMVHKIPDTVSFEQGALVEPAAVALYAVRQSQFNVGDQAVVFGTGPIGLLVIEALKASGASKIYAVELSTERRQRAEQLGAIALNPAEVNVVEEIQRLTDGGADVSFEVTGVPIVLTQAIESTKLNGQTMIVSIFEKEASFQPNLVVMRERNIAGIIGYRDIFPAVISLMNQGYFSAETLVTKRIGLHDIVEQGFEALMKEKSQVKILVSPDR
ncbi:2,3-butanediol dehydrogenase [Halalkalibacterium halodurans]|uniref:Butanediol dehydrogenase n=1 Tax=Halalkalibacterium halodurans TaxID=86665 RepID=A0A0M0KFA4_ALKHA|nr:2,3-butanediol dehydrogenase [Halalkalibacterium halodurans]MED3645783.1 2,3-butanediol dehydrogenase [Halalkalibacterium halodurans]MED4079662.1 2,3-butanediol dehydrogenase [Halalkalibacterium halodurans]MED4084062.1 2,3-butanediol dehydrogenase [Halalkalibacterium halodurans]MED4104540.1 2,3-butanediol dehydrogenase [Halalkalibacterium halodurans]MED4108267.1 2,3-butanediol dehydrogenase [Halalkalibacterium halodurans]